MPLSGSYAFQLVISLIAILAPIAGASVIAIRLHVRHRFVFLLGVLYVAAVLFVYYRDPYISTLSNLGAAATAASILVGGLSYLVTRGGDHFIAVLMGLLTVILVAGSVLIVVQHSTNTPSPPGPQLPFAKVPSPTAIPSPSPSPSASRASATTATPSGSSGSSGSSNSGGSGGPKPPGPSPTSTSTSTSTPTPTPPRPTSTPIPPTPTPTPVPVTVQGASAAITSTSPPSSCIVTIQVAGTISTNGGRGTIDYYWNRSDGTRSPTYNFGATTGTTSYAVNDTWEPQVSYTPSTYWDQLIVTAPNIVDSNQASETLSC